MEGSFGQGAGGRPRGFGGWRPSSVEKPIEFRRVCCGVCRSLVVVGGGADGAGTEILVWMVVWFWCGGLGFAGWVLSRVNNAGSGVVMITWERERGIG